MAYGYNRGNPVDWYRSCHRFFGGGIDIFSAQGVTTQTDTPAAAVV
jgi:hypothetical protein